MLNIFYGRECIDKEKFIYDNIGGRALLIVPDQFTLEAERELFAHLKAEALMDIEVLSMSRLGYRLLEELGGSRRTFVDKYGRHMILSAIAAREKDKLQVFKGMESRDSFISLVNEFISDMKQYNCGADELKDMADRAAEGSYTQRKLADLYMLYSEYEKAIDGKYTDSEDYIELFLDKIGSSKLIAGNHIWIYGFDSFTPKAMSVIGELMSAAADVNVVLTYDEDKNARDAELFALSEMVIYNFERAAESRGIAVCKRAIPREYTAVNKAEEIRFLEAELYALPAKSFEQADKCRGCEPCGDSTALTELPAVTLVAAANLYNEAESAACYVRRLVRDYGYRFSDIKLICNDQESRGPILRRVFKEYEIELLSDAKKDIMQSPIVRYITALIDIVAERYRSDIVMQLFKSGFGNLTDDEVTDIENYSIKYKIRGSMWKKAFIRGESEYGSEAMLRLNEIREKGLSFAAELESVFKADTVGEFIAAFYRFLYDTVKLPDKIAALINEQQEHGRADLADETAQIWGKVVGILDQMAEIAGEEKFRTAAFRDLFVAGLSQVEIGVLPPTKDGLMMGTMQRTRTGEMKALVVVGANEGILPNEKAASGLFGSDEKNMFCEKGIELCKVDNIRFLEERMGIYRNLSKPTERLWMGYSMSDAEGGAAKPSGVFTKLSELFPKTPIARDILNCEDDSELVGAGTAGIRHLTEALQTACEGKPLRAHWAEALSWYKRNDPAALEPIRQGIGFSNRQNDLDRKMTEELYAGRKYSQNDLPPLSPGQTDVQSLGSGGSELTYVLPVSCEPQTLSDSLSTEVCGTPVSADVHPADITAAPPTTLSISPSRLERFARCPFSHFVQYGLKPEERRIFEVAPREIGDIYHECLMQLSGSLTKKGVAVTDPASPWMTITREECRAFVDQLVSRQAESYREGVFAVGNEEKYRAGRIADICEKVCWTVIEQVRSGQIVSCDFEVPFGRGRKISPIAVPLNDGRTVYIEGKIDRVDYLPSDRVKIIDYKTGNESFSISEAEAGYRLQLMLYLEASLEQKRKPAGVFYFKISEPMIDASGGEMTAAAIASQIKKNFKLNGVIANDPDVIRNVAGDFEGISDIVPIRFSKKESTFSGTGKDNLLSDEEFDELRTKVAGKVTELCRELASGKIDIHPMKTGQSSACAYCEYRGICRFDTIFEGCRYNIIS